ncbi:MAG: DUF4203 domain-containing protein [candidate division WOR-3 bacterium]|nr:DUF4203 domain-containing protein [candidate division WOR-3 bacterium]
MNVVSTVSPALLLIAGFVVCLFGYRLLRFTLALVGFAAGFLLGPTVARLIPGASPIVVLIVGIVCGLVGAVVATLLYKVGVFILGAVAGVLIASIVLTAVGWQQPLLVRVIAAAAGGILTLIVERPLVSILSAFLGGWGVVLGAFQLLGWYHVTAGAKSSPANYGFMVLAWVIIGILGSLAQLRGGRRWKDEG